ncbi:MAG TPA: ABC transporter ATP-binding protein [Patescibacteria group bacterium]|nr:ABC transporter ATP-binding protein [Patescibacteria group bacterium]
MAKPLVWGKLIAILVFRDISTIHFLIVNLAAITFIELLVSLFQTYLFSYINKGITLKIKSEMYNRIINLSLEIFDKMKIGDFMSRLNGDATTVSDIITNQLMGALVNILKAIVVGIVIFKINAVMALIVVLSFPLSYLVFYRFGKILRQKNMEIKALNDKYYSFTQQSFAGMREIKSQGLKKYCFGAFTQIITIQKLKHINMALNNSMAILLSGILSATSNIMVIIVGTYFILHNSMPLEYLIAFTAYSNQFSNSLLSITSLNASIQQALVSLERIFEVIDSFYSHNEKFGSLRKISIEGNISFENVSLTYGGRNQILNNISLKINKYQKTAIVGRSGSGKSSIINLLLRFYEPDSGCIKIDSININEYDEETLRSQISVVMQEPYLFNMSIRENLLAANENSTDDIIIEACKQACIHDYINMLPEKYDTIIGENGVNFSVGQKQRIAIARCLLKDAKVILFDEATASLDNESTYSIINTLKNVSSNHTVVIIAHRLMSITDADNIILIDDGILVGQGNHEYLVKNNTYYQRLYEKELLQP